MTSREEFAHDNALTSATMKAKLLNEEFKPTKTLKAMSNEAQDWITINSERTRMWVKLDVVGENET